jgi:hypothetical protein
MAIAYDIQVTLGLLLYVATRAWDGTDPFYRAIHPALMLVGLVVVHVTAKRTRTAASPRARHAWLCAGSVVALVVAAGGGAVR